MSRQPIVALAVTLFLSASPGVGAQTLRIGMQADPATLDPAQSASFVDRVALAAVCDKLIDLDAKLSFVPQLATEWSWADDGLALTMKLPASSSTTASRSTPRRSGSTSSATRPPPTPGASPS
jgi:ABC-type transport system substrate-binding protein